VVVRVLVDHLEAGIGEPSPDLSGVCDEAICGWYQSKLEKSVPSASSSSFQKATS